MAKNEMCPCSLFSPADPKTFIEDTHEMSKSQQLIDIKISFIHNIYYSGFIFLDLLIKLMEMMLLYILCSSRVLDRRRGGGGWGALACVGWPSIKRSFFGASFRIAKAMRGCQRVFHKKQTELGKNPLITANFFL
jgi:hypothetical protein